MALVTVTELKSVLGVGSLYPDADLTQVCSAADAVVRSYLVNNNKQITHYTTANNVGFVFTAEPHGLEVGESITITGVSTAFNATFTITTVGYMFVGFVLTGTDFLPRQCNPYGTLVGPTQFVADNVPACKEAALTIAVDMWTNRVAPGGQPQGVDFQPSPWRMGRSLMARVSGLLAPYMNTGGLVG